MTAKSLYLVLEALVVQIDVIKDAIILSQVS